MNAYSCLHPCFKGEIRCVLSADPVIVMGDVLWTFCESTDKVKFSL